MPEIVPEVRELLMALEVMGLPTDSSFDGAMPAIAAKLLPMAALVSLMTIPLTLLVADRAAAVAALTLVTVMV